MFLWPIQTFRVKICWPRSRDTMKVNCFIASSWSRCSLDKLSRRVQLLSLLGLNAFTTGFQAKGIFSSEAKSLVLPFHQWERKRVVSMCIIFIKISISDDTSCSFMAIQARKIWISFKSQPNSNQLSGSFLGELSGRMPRHVSIQWRGGHCGKCLAQMLKPYVML